MASIDAIPSGQSRIHWVIGQRLQFKLRSRAELDLGTSAKVMDYELEARVELSVLDSTTDRDVLLIRIADPSVGNHASEGSANLENLTRELQAGESVSIMSRGQLAELRFPTRMSSHAKSTFRQVAASFQFPVQLGQGKAYAEEYDTTGKYLAQYSYDDASQTYLKAKLHYITLLGSPKGPNGVPIALVPQIVKSESRIRLSVNGRPESLKFEDEVILKGAQAPFHSTTNVRLELASVERSDPLAELHARADKLIRIPADSSDVAGAGVEALDQARTGGASFHEIVLRVEAEQGSHSGQLQRKERRKSRVASLDSRASKPYHEEGGDPKLFAALAASLRSEAGAVAQATKMIMSRSTITATLIDALGAAGCSACESALIGMLDSPDVEIVRRSRYVLARIPTPGERAVSTMMAILDKKPYDQTALFALGAYSRHFRDDGRVDKASQLGEILVGRLTSAAGNFQVIAALRSIQNAGYAKALGAVERFLDDRDDTVRAAAILALGPMKEPRVDTLLASRFAPNISTETKLTVLEAARERPPSNGLVAAISESFWTSPVNVRSRAVDLLGEWLSQRPDLRTLLERIGQSDSEERIRNRAKGLL